MLALQKIPNEAQTIVILQGMDSSVPQGEKPQTDNSGREITAGDRRTKGDKQ